MWNEQLGRSVETFKINRHPIVSHDPAWQEVPSREPVLLLPNQGKQYVQVLRTVPRMNFTLSAKERGKFLIPDFRPKKFGIMHHRIVLRPKHVAFPGGLITSLVSSYERPRLNFARNGCFEFKVALKRAISEANDYIFIADQSMYAMEIMDWINSRMMHRPHLKVILLLGRDPADPPESFLPEAINNHLLPNVFRDNNGVPNSVVFYSWTDNCVHCKVTIIDDVWCAIGSANCMRRSLYTDIELSVSILEPATPDVLLPTTPAEEANLAPNQRAPSFVQRFRRDLWAHYCGIPLVANKRTRSQNRQYTELLNLAQALAVWRSAGWGAAPQGLWLLDNMHLENLAPFPASAEAFSQKAYNQKDPDSRKAF
jgi:hypothetical protein